MPYEYRFAHSPNGLAVHLVKARTTKALCGVEIALIDVPTPFDLNGCRKCARAAVRDGTTYLYDVDDEKIQLEGWVPYWDR